MSEMSFGQPIHCILIRRSQCEVSNYTRDFILTDLTYLVVDFLASGDVPSQLLNHPLIHTSAVDTWNYGLLEGVDNEGILSRLLHSLDRTGTPR